MIDSRSAVEKVRLALQLHEDGVRLQRQNLRRAHPDATAKEIERLLRSWLAHHPGAEHGDAPGRPASWPRSLTTSRGS